MILGLSGYAGAGKDALAGALIAADPTWRRVAFADRLRSVTEAIDPDVNGIRLSWLLQLYGWEGLKRHGKHGPAVRGLLQRTGCAVRDHIGPSTWVDAALDGVDGNVVVTDVRFRNEAEAVQARGGLVVRVHRPGVGPVNDHPSEVDLDDFRFDRYVVNDSTPAGMVEALGLVSIR